MTIHRVIPVSRWLVAALLVATGQFAIAPASVQARCGDYVMLGGHAAHSRESANESVRMPHAPTGMQPLAHLELNHSRRSDGGRCSGPNCSNDVPRPLDEPTVPVETEVRHWGLFSAQWLPVTVSGQMTRFADDTIVLQIAGGSVFRPPR